MRARADELEADGQDVGTYLLNQCRHAVAHADREPFVNPDDLDDHVRLHKDLPLIRNLAELAIEQSFRIKRRSTIYREHLYELDGFRQMIPTPIVDALKRGDRLPEDAEITFPDNILLIARHGPDRCQLSNMTLTNGAWIDGGLILDFQSATGTIKLRAMLDFAEEKLHFDPIRSLIITPDRTDRNRVVEELAVLRFQRCILSNGHLEIWDSDSETRLGCSETFIPVNCFVNDKYFDSDSAALESILASPA
jgi:methylamine utilization protein MauJ